MRQRLLSRSVSPRFVAVLCGIAAVGCTGTGGQQAGSTVYDDAGNCVKDREALSEILVQPQACVSSAECPPGSFCNGETGQCDWECYTDSDCGFGATCSCDGICQDGTPPPGGSAADPACPRDLTLLQSTSPDIHNRECTTDEHCPYGARCDAETHRCDYDCLADADCTGGDVCSCRGECVEPGCAESVPDQRVPTVEVTPDVITVLPGNTWGKQTFSIRITDPDSTIGSGLLPRARIEVPTPTGLGNLGIPQSEAVAETINTYAGVHFSTTEESRALAHANTATATTLNSGGIPLPVANRMVAARPFAGLANVLDVDGAGASTLQALKTATKITSSASCTVQVRELTTTRWVVSTTSGYNATTSVSINRCSAVENYPRDIRVSVYFVDAVDTTKVVRHLAYRTVRIDTAGAPSVTATSATGEFSGYLVQEGVTGDPLTIPVRAFASDTTTLKIFDDLKLLSSTGWFQLSTAPTFLNHIDQATGNGGVSPGQTPGVLGGQLGGWIDELLTGGRRDGHFTVTLASAPTQPLSFRYRLVRKGPGTAPSVPANPTSSVNTLATLSDAWRARAGFLHNAAPFPGTTRANLIERLLCYAYDGSVAAAAPLVGPSEQEDPDIRAWPQLILSSVSADLECSKRIDESHAQTSIGLLTGWGRWIFSVWEPSPGPPITTPPDETVAWLSECLGDLARPIPNLGTADTVAEQTEAWFGAPGSCINLAQVLPALASLVHDPIDLAATRYVDRRDGGLFQRLLAEWLDVHAFVLQQGVQTSASAAPLITDVSPAPLATLLARAERGWDVLFDSDFVNAVSGLPGPQLAAPDYRNPRPTSYWTFDTGDRSVNHMRDVAGSNNLDFVGTVNSDSQGINLVSGANASIPASRLSPTGDVALTFWIKPSTVSPVDTDVYIFNAGSAFFVRVRRSSSTGNVTVTAGHGGYTFPSSSSLPGTAVWQHVVATRRGNQYAMFFGATSIPPNTAQPTNNPGANTTGVTVVGSPGTGSVAIDDLAIWENSLTLNHAAQIASLGQSNIPPQNISRPLLTPIGSIWTPSSSNPSYYIPPDPNAEIGIGLPAKILEAAARHAEVVDAYASQELQKAYGGCFATGTSSEQQASVSRAAASLRYVNAAEALARRLRTRAGQIACTGALECTTSGGTTCGAQGVCMAGAATLDVAPAWNSRYQSALLELAAIRSRAVSSIARLGACENPLSIPEDDLPIYFGDVEGTNSRYFASSDYLAASWARPAVQSAMYSLEAAREGWLAKRDSDIRQQMNEYEAERRLEGINLSYAHPVMDACGMNDEDGSTVLAGTIDATTCFRVPGCTPANDPTCLRGSLGEAMLGVRSAIQAVGYEMKQSAKRELEWYQQIQTCAFVEQSVAMEQTAVDAYRQAADDARDRSGGLFGNAMGFVSDAIDTALPGSPADDVGLDDQLVDALRGCMSGGTGCAIGFVTSDGGARDDLEAARIDLDIALETGRSARELYGCWDEVQRRQRDWIFGKDAILLRTEDLKQAWFRFDEQVRSVDRQVKEGKAAIAREEGRTLPSVAHHYWVDEKIARYQRDFARAKRFTYLAMRAVEYEFQQSLGLRTQILTAEHPDDLVEALDILDAERATRSINSRRPAPGTEVLSLRSDVLGIDDLHAPAPGERADAGSRRLQDILTSPEYAYYDDDGEYLGQAVPFTVSESGALRHRCGERLWRVTATIQGDLTDVDEPRAQVYLLKRNVFKSQWCEGLGDGTPYQQGSTAGGSNLFTADATTVGRQGSEVTPALIYPWYNVRRSDFYRDDYTQGSSEELAGRGLYGEYVLLFPKFGMLEPPADCAEVNVCSDGTSAGCSDPFRDLRRIEDVLIRFDYYSVDDL